MARDLETLVVSLDADITRLAKQLAKAGVNLDDFAKTADKKADAAAKAINKHLGEGGGTSGGLNFVQFEVLEHAARASFDALSAGANPLKVLAQEGVRASAAIGPGGLGGLVKALGTSLGTVISPALLAGGAVAAVGAAAVLGYADYEAAQEKLRIGLSGIGAASHATVADIEEIGAEIAKTSNISRAAGRDIALAIAQTGAVDKSQIAQIGNLAKGFGVLTGQSTASAGQNLAKIFSDPAKGAEELNARLADLDGNTLHYIRTLAESGDVQKANQAILNAVGPDILKAADNVSVLTSAYEALKRAYEHDPVGETIGKAVARAVDGPSLDDQIAITRRALADAQQSSPDTSGLDVFGGEAAVDTGEAVIGLLKQQLALLERTKAAKDAAATRDADVRRAVVQSNAATPAIQEADPQLQAIEQLETRLATVRTAIENAQNLGVQPDGGYDHAVAAADTLDAKLKELKADYAQGGTAAANAFRQADFQRQTAGLSSYERGLQQINHQYDDLIRQAKEAGNLRGVPELEQAKTAAVAAFQRESVDRARQQAVIEPNFTDVVIGAEGNSAAQNSRSSASGIGQFIDPTFIALYRKEFSDLASTMSDQAILALKGDVDVNKKLIEAYGRQNAVTLQNAGFDATNANLYLAHNYGAQGAINLLNAAPGASAASVLGQNVVAANPNIAGLDAQGVIAEATRRAQRFSQSGQAQQSQVVSERAAAEAYDASAAAAARLSSIQEQLDADRARGGDLGRQFATATDLVKASSDKLTPALAQQRDEILRLAAARAQVTQAGLSSRFETDTKNQTDALGRTSEQQAVFTQARGYADPNDPSFAAYEAKLQDIRNLAEVKDTGSSFAKGLTQDLIAGTRAGQALENQLQRIVGKLSDTLIDNAFSSIFGALLKSGSGGLLSGLGGLLSGSALALAGGGRVVGPGSGTSDSIPAFLSHGEFVMSAAATQKHGALLAALNSGTVRRFAQGGSVDLPAIPIASVPRGSGGSGNFTHAPTYNITPANGVTPAELSAVLERHDRQLDRTIGSRMANWSKRYG